MAKANYLAKKFLEVNGLRLAYLETGESNKSTIFFIHGNSSSSSLWRRQMTDKSFAEYRLVAIDLPGHGDSDACTNPKEDYSPIITGKIMAEATKKLSRNESYVLVGFSYGTNLIAEMLVNGANPVGICFSAPCIVGKNYEPTKLLLNPDSNIFLMEEVSRDKAEKFFDINLKGKIEEDIDNYLNDFFSVDPLFRGSMIQSGLGGNHSDEILAMRKHNVPLFIVFGKHDRLIDPNYLDDASLPLWRNEIIKLEDTGHFVQTDQPETFNQLLHEYCADRLK